MALLGSYLNSSLSISPLTSFHAGAHDNRHCERERTWWGTREDRRTKIFGHVGVQTLAASMAGECFFYCAMRLGQHCHLMSSPLPLRNLRAKPRSQIRAQFIYHISAIPLFSCFFIFLFHPSGLIMKETNSLWQFWIFEMNKIILLPLMLFSSSQWKLSACNFGDGLRLFEITKINNILNQMIFSFCLLTRFVYLTGNGCYLFPTQVSLQLVMVWLCYNKY